MEFIEFCQYNVIEDIQRAIDQIESSLQEKDFVYHDVSLTYACINEELANIKPTKNKITTNRSCIKKTLDDKGLGYIGQLCSQNIKDLIKIIYWNKLHHIYVFRVSADTIPWLTHIKYEDLPNFQEIKGLLSLAGRLAIICKQRLTMHFSHFVSLASTNSNTVKNSIHEINQTSKFFNLMNFEPSLFNKLCLHISGVFGDKTKTLERFCENFQMLEEHSKKRIALELDDSVSKYTFDDLLPIAQKLDCGIVMDSLHFQCNPGKMTGFECVEKAIEIWSNKGVKPICHLSEQRLNHRSGAHSDLVENLPDYYEKYKDKIDIIIESKRKEEAVFHLRNNLRNKLKAK